MAYRAILGGSPLGLIGVRSTVPSGAPSSFNAGKTRNIENVDDYNNKMGINHPGSLFTGKRFIRAWPDIKAIPEQNIGDIKVPSGWDTAGTQDVQYGVSDTSSRKTLHNDMVYDTSILNIIEQLSNTKAQLKPADFAYLKNVGVYPNNRLMIARRFASPADDNIMVKKKNTELSALAVLISWLPENQNYLEISFGEIWEDTADADFSSILSSLGADVAMKAGGPLDLGSILGSGAGVVPLPGFTEIFQRQFLAKLGLIEDSAKNMIPVGNPNLIKMAKQRKTIGYGQAGSGLTCNVTIKMICEYELKFISGIDPTIVWMDLLGMILRFGTSNSESYGLSKNASSKVIDWANNPNHLIDDVVKGLQSSLNNIITEVTDQIKGMTPGSSGSSGNSGISADIITKGISGLANSITSGLLQKYRVRIIGVINALSGLPSSPWHITIGNPLRPVFCSGDMVTTNVNLKLGPILAFNDLPSSILVEFDLSNARPWGLQEIMAKFNSGYLRTVDTQKTFYETKSYEKEGNTYIESVGRLPFDSQNGTSSGSSGTSGLSGNANNSNTTNNTSDNGGSTSQVGVSSNGSAINSSSGDSGKSYIEGGKNQNPGKINSDPNSTNVVVDKGKK